MFIIHGLQKQVESTGYMLDLQNKQTSLLNNLLHFPPKFHLIFKVVIKIYIFKCMPSCLKVESSDIYHLTVTIGLTK